MKQGAGFFKIRRIKFLTVKACKRPGYCRMKQSCMSQTAQSAGLRDDDFVYLIDAYQQVCDIIGGIINRHLDYRLASISKSVRFFAINSRTKGTALSVKRPPSVEGSWESQISRAAKMR